MSLCRIEPDRTGLVETEERLPGPEGLWTRSTAANRRTEARVSKGLSQGFRL